jgi:hypothetical protein
LYKLLVSFPSEYIQCTIFLLWETKIVRFYGQNDINEKCRLQSSNDTVWRINNEKRFDWLLNANINCIWKKERIKRILLHYERLYTIFIRYNSVSIKKHHKNLSMCILFYFTVFEVVLLFVCFKLIFIISFLYLKTCVLISDEVQFADTREISNNLFYVKVL